MGQFYKRAEQLTIDLCPSAGTGDSVGAEMTGRVLADASSQKTTAGSVSLKLVSLGWDSFINGLNSLP